MAERDDFPMFARSGSDELVDLRSKVNLTTNAVLDAHAFAKDKDKAEIVREVLDKWAEQQMHVATLIQRMTRSEGGGADSRGKGGST